MLCTATITLQAITHTGADIGDDWSYSVTVAGGLHRIPLRSGRGKPGVNELPQVMTWTVTGQPGTVLEVPVVLEATEHDVIFDDTGQTRTALAVRCPPGGQAYTGVTQEVRVRVSEKLAGTNTVTFRFEIAARSDG